MGATPVPGTLTAVLNGPATRPAQEGERAAVIAEVNRYCDLAERLTLVPPSARVRGVYYGSIASALAEAGLLPRYKAIFPEKIGTLAWRPVGDFLVHLAVGGALLVGPARVHEGMIAIGRHNALEFANSLLGRVMMRLLSKDPKKLLMQGAAGRRQTCAYGEWRVAFPDERTAVVEMKEEYLYLDSYCLGSAMGTFEAVGLAVEAKVELRDRFHGRHVLTW